MPLMSFTRPEAISLLLDGRKKQTTRLRRIERLVSSNVPDEHFLQVKKVGRELKVGDTLYCYYRSRMKKGYCGNCLKQYYPNPVCESDTISRDRKHSVDCDAWTNYFGGATITKIENLNIVFYQDLILNVYNVEINDALLNQNKELWAKLDGFKDFVEANEWFSKEYGRNWQDLPFVVITFEPKWLKGE